MKKINFLTILLFIIVGCGQNVVVNFDKNSTLVIAKQVNSGSPADYEVINKIEDLETVQKVIDILKGTKWQTNLEVDMEHESDYKLNDTYHIWITPQGDMLEIINTNNSNYARLSESDSFALYKLMTGNELDSNFLALNNFYTASKFREYYDTIILLDK